MFVEEYQGRLHQDCDELAYILAVLRDLTFTRVRISLGARSLDILRTSGLLCRWFSIIPVWVSAPGILAYTAFFYFLHFEYSKFGSINVINIFDRVWYIVLYMGFVNIKKFPKRNYYLYELPLELRTVCHHVKHAQTASRLRNSATQSLCLRKLSTGLTSGSRDWSDEAATVSRRRMHFVLSTRIFSFFKALRTILA